MNGHNIMVEEGGMGVPMEINYRSQNPNAQQYLSPDIIVNPPGEGRFPRHSHFSTSNLAQGNMDIQSPHPYYNQKTPQSYVPNTVMGQAGARQMRGLSHDTSLPNLQAHGHPHQAPEGRTGIQDLFAQAQYSQNPSHRPSISIEPPLSDFKPSIRIVGQPQASPKADLLNAYKDQMRLKEETKKLDKLREKQEELKLLAEQDRYQYFGKGGGGAPLKDKFGRVIASRRPQVDEAVNKYGQKQYNTNEKTRGSYDYPPTQMPMNYQMGMGTMEYEQMGIPTRPELMPPPSPRYDNMDTHISPIRGDVSADQMKILHSLELQKEIEAQIQFKRKIKEEELKRERLESKLEDEKIKRERRELEEQYKVEQIDQKRKEDERNKHRAVAMENYALMNERKANKGKMEKIIEHKKNRVVKFEGETDPQYALNEVIVYENNVQIQTDQDTIQKDELNTDKFVQKLPVQIKDQMQHIVDAEVIKMKNQMRENDDKLKRQMNSMRNQVMYANDERDKAVQEMKMIHEEVKQQKWEDKLRYQNVYDSLITSLSNPSDKKTIFPKEHYEFEFPRIDYKKIEGDYGQMLKDTKDKEELNSTSKLGIIPHHEQRKQDMLKSRFKKECHNYEGVDVDKDVFNFELDNDTLGRLSRDSSRTQYMEDINYKNERRNIIVGEALRGGRKYKGAKHKDKNMNKQEDEIQKFLKRDEIRNKDLMHFSHPHTFNSNTSTKSSHKHNNIHHI